MTAIITIIFCSVVHIVYCISAYINLAYNDEMFNLKKLNRLQNTALFYDIILNNSMKLMWALWALLSPFILSHL